MGPIALPLLAAGTIMSAAGQYQQGHNAAQAAKYNAGMADQNAKIQERNAVIAGQSGAVQVQREQMKSRALAGDILANQGASGVTVNEGSFPAVRGSQASIDMMDAYNTRAAAVREAYGYQNQAANSKAEAESERFKAKKTEQGALIGAAGTLIGGGVDAFTKYKTYRQAGGLGSTGGKDTTGQSTVAVRGQAEYY